MEEDATQDLGEFSVANAIYAALVEAHASEISSRSVQRNISYILTALIYLLM